MTGTLTGRAGENGGAEERGRGSQVDNGGAEGYEGTEEVMGR